MEKFDWQQGYYIGKEYVEDIEKKEVIIKYCIKMPVRFDDFNFNVSGNIKIIQKEGKLFVNIIKTISKKLFYDMSENIGKAVEDNNVEAAKKYVNASRFIIGYISSTLPLVIDEIYKKKYLEGHLLVGTISLSEITDIAIISNDNKEGVAIMFWPLPIPPFPPSKFLAEEADAIFIRDFIEAATCYFRYDVNEGVRKIITSLENYWINYSLKIKGKTFKNLVDAYIVEENYPYKENNLKIIRKNIKYIYNIRNLIVHDRLRLKASDVYLLKMAIGILSYIYKDKFISINHSNYITFLAGQFILIDKEFNCLNLDHLVKQEENHTEPNIIEKEEDLDNFIFNAFELSNEYVSEINKKYNINLEY